MDRINRGFAALAKVHAGTYLLVGGICTISIYMFFLDAKASIDG